MSERKASEVILDVENLLQRIAGTVQNTDNNVKLILDRLNRLIQLQTSGSQQSVPAPAPIRQPQLRMQQPVRGEALDSAPIEDNKSQLFVARPVQEQSFELDEHGQPELMEEVLHRGKRRDLRKPADSAQSKKVAVSQMISFPDGKAIFMASVEVFDGNGKLVKQTRTNSQGRWLAPLEPGEYTVHILKRPGADSRKLPVELRFQVQIPESSGPVELPTPDLPAIYNS